MAKGPAVTGSELQALPSRQHALEPSGSLQGLEISLPDALRREEGIDRRRHTLVRQKKGRQGAGNYPASTRNRFAKLDFSPPTESLLPCAIRHFQWQTQTMKPGVHGFVEYGGGDLGV
jgi:hypothetical protein